jgi:hypothetical protein
MPNLMSCPDCQHGMSTLAEHCPHCGRPHRPQPVVTTRHGLRPESAGFLVMVLGLFIMLFANPLVGMLLPGGGFGLAIIGRMRY